MNRYVKIRMSVGSIHVLAFATYVEIDIIGLSSLYKKDIKPLSIPSGNLLFNHTIDPLHFHTESH